MNIIIILIIIRSINDHWVLMMEFNKRGKQYKINYFGALGELFKDINDNEQMDSLSGEENNPRNENKGQGEEIS